MVKKKTSTAKSKKTAKKSSKPKGYQVVGGAKLKDKEIKTCLLYTSPSPRDQRGSRMPSSA